MKKTTGKIVGYVAVLTIALTGVNALAEYTTNNLNDY